jgi:GTP cyclohydrolase IA
MAVDTRIPAEHDAVEHAAKMLAALGIHGDDQTPLRLVRALDELAGGRDLDPRRHLAVRFPPVTTRPTLVVVTDVPFVSVCEHHVLPFHGHATVAYLPEAGQDIVGLSKLSRLVVEQAARPQVQERLTEQIVDALVEVLEPAGAAVAVRGSHSCMAHRGARAGADAAMVTTQYAGALETDPWRGEFLARLDTPAWRA